MHGKALGYSMDIENCALVVWFCKSLCPTEKKKKKQSQESKTADNNQEFAEEVLSRTVEQKTQTPGFCLHTLQTLLFRECNSRRKPLNTSLLSSDSLCRSAKNDHPASIPNSLSIISGSAQCPPRPGALFTAFSLPNRQTKVSYKFTVSKPERAVLCSAHCRPLFPGNLSHRWLHIHCPPHRSHSTVELKP